MLASQESNVRLLCGEAPGYSSSAQKRTGGDMNGSSSERQRKREEARPSLTPAEITEINRRDHAEQVLLARAEYLHERIFPEEYNEVYDSSADAKLRAQGVNPMSRAYTDRVNARRRAMGVVPFMEDHIERSNAKLRAMRLAHLVNETQAGKAEHGLATNSKAWLVQMLREGRDIELQAFEEQVRREKAAPLTPEPDITREAPETISADLDAYLADRTDLLWPDRSPEDQLAIRAYGFFLARNFTNFQETLLNELRRLLGEPDEKLWQQINMAYEFWMDAYG